MSLLPITVPRWLKAALCAAVLTGCANGGYPVAPSDTRASSGSGITVFGEIDAGVSQVRGSR